MGASAFNLIKLFFNTDALYQQAILSKGRQDTQHNDIQHNDTQHNDILHNNK